MTKEELKALVASKLEGQGNQTDISGALSVVLNELIDGMGGEVKIIRLGEVDFYGGENTQLNDEQRNEVWKSVYGHDFPETDARVIEDVKGNPSPVIVESFLAKNIGESGVNKVFSGWVYSASAESERGGSALVLIVNPLETALSITISEF